MAIVQTANVQLHSRIQTLDAAPDVLAFQRVLSVKADDDQQVFANSDVWPAQRVDHGFVDAENLTKMLAHQPFDRLPFIFLSDQEKALLVAEGFHAEGLDFHILEQRNPLDWMESNSWTADNVVRVSTDQSQVFDRHGSPLPQAVFMDYIESGITESSHDLEAVAVHLLNRADVRVLHRDAVFMERTATSVEEALCPRGDHEGEAETCGRSMSVQFVWQPSATDYKKLWGDPGDDTHWFYRASQLPRDLMEMDILGLRQFQINQNA